METPIVTFFCCAAAAVARPAARPAKVATFSTVRFMYLSLDD
jgi:hypothetical protein